MSYSELSVEERVTIQLGQAQGFSLRRAPSVRFDLAQQPWTRVQALIRTSKRVRVCFIAVACLAMVYLGAVYRLTGCPLELGKISKEQLDAIALQLNMRPRKRFDFKRPIEIMGQVMPDAGSHVDAA